MEQKQNVLFLCTSNSCRSQMAEAFLRKFAGERFNVYSAGLRPEPIHPLTYRVMGEVGIDLDGHRSKGVKEFLVGMIASYGTRIGVRAKIRIGEEATRRCSVGRGIAVAGPPTKQRARILKSCSSCRASRDH